MATSDQFDKLRDRAKEESRLDELDRRLDQIEAETARLPADAKTHLQPQVTALRARLEKFHSLARDKEQAEDQEQDAALAELDHLIDDTYTTLMGRPT